MDDILAGLATARRHTDLLAEAAKSDIGLDVVERLAAILRVSPDRPDPVFAKIELYFGARMSVDLREIVSRYLYLVGSFEQELSAFFHRYLAPGMTFLDVGAHHGYFSLLAADRVGPDGRVAAIEPTPRTFRLLSDNLEGMANADAHAFAAWSSETEITFNDFGPAWSAFNSSFAPRISPEKGLEAKAETVTVKTVTIDGFCAANGLAPDVIKIDAETAELEVLRGMRGIIRSLRPVVTLETGDMPHLLAAGAPSTAQVMQFLQVQNYNAFDVTLEGVRRHRTKPGARYAYGNVVCVPAEKTRALDALRFDV